MKNFKSIIWATVIVIALSIVFYIINFFDSGLSPDTSKWGAFSDYLNPFVAIANLIIITWLSIQVFKYNQKKDTQNDEFQKSIEKPIIVFKSSQNEKGGETWVLRNIGKGAALNIKVGESGERIIDWTIPTTKCYSLAQGEDLHLVWLKRSNVLCATYEDIFGNPYVSIGADDESSFRPLNNDFKQIIIDGFVFEKNHFVFFNKLQTQRLHQARNDGSSFSTTAQTTLIP